jgi:CRISPR-associated protein Cas2
MGIPRIFSALFIGKRMHYLLIYDITDDRARTKVADLCLDYGLERIQYSAFCGDLPRTLQEELLLKIGRILRGKTADVRLIPMCERDWSQCQHLHFPVKGGVNARR